MTENPKYEYASGWFGNEVRLVIVKNSMEVGAIQRRKQGEKTRQQPWDAFAQFGQEGFNKDGFDSEEAALAAAREWFQARLDATKLAFERANAAFAQDNS